MIYIWYNPISKSYQLGALKDFKTLRNAEKSQEDFLLLYKFDQDKSWLAQKILGQLNAQGSESNNTISDTTFIGYINTEE
ncbi:MAG: hypothetical protein AAFQ94_14200 [Bacteroidota bacterium]